MRQRPSRQGDLFEADQQMLEILTAQKPLIVSLIERMLVEALADDSVATHATSDKAREVADEQDRP
jgi:hypothetical protein